METPVPDQSPRWAAHVGTQTRPSGSQVPVSPGRYTSRRHERAPDLDQTHWWGGAKYCEGGRRLPQPWSRCNTSCPPPPLTRSQIWNTISVAAEAPRAAVVRDQWTCHATQVVDSAKGRRPRRRADVPDTRYVDTTAVAFRSTRTNRLLERKRKKRWGGLSAAGLEARHTSDTPPHQHAAAATASPSGLMAWPSTSGIAPLRFRRQDDAP